MLNHVFHANIIAYCQQNRCVWFAIYINLFTLRVAVLNKANKRMRLYPTYLCLRMLF